MNLMKITFFCLFLLLINLQAYFCNSSSQTLENVSECNKLIWIAFFSYSCECVFLILLNQYRAEGLNLLCKNPKHQIIGYGIRTLLIFSNNRYFVYDFGAFQMVRWGRLTDQQTSVLVFLSAPFYYAGKVYFFSVIN